MDQSEGKCGCGCGGAAGDTSTAKDAAAPPDAKAASDMGSALLSKRDEQLLARAVRLAQGDGGKLDGAGTLWGALDGIAALSTAAQALLDGALPPAEFQAQVQGIEPWPAKLLSGRWGRTSVAPALRMPPVGPMLGAAFVAGSIEGGVELGRQQAARAVTALLWRAEPLARVVHAARALDAGQLDAPGFGQVLSLALQWLAAPPNPAEFVRQLSNSPVVWPAVPGGGIDGPGWPRRPPFSVWLLPENLAWAHCALGVASSFKPLADIPKVSPGPARIEPASLCGGGMVPPNGWQITLHGKAFGAQGPWGVAVNGRAARVVSWQDDTVVIETRELRPGCNPVTWTFNVGVAPEDNGVGAACLEALRIPRRTLGIGAEYLLANNGRFWVQPGSISVMAPRIARFTASAGIANPAEPCADVTLDWQVEDLPCGTEQAELRVSLWRDGQLIADHLPFGGSFVEREPIDRDLDYRLVVVSTDGAGQPCADVDRSLTIRRAPKRLTLAGPAQVTPRAAARMTLSIPCPAPAGGLDVTLVSQPPGSLSHPPQVQVPAGARQLQFDVGVGVGPCGTATLSAQAPDHVDASRSLCVQLPPRIVGFTPPAGLKACERFTLQVAADCVAVPPALRAFAVDGAGTRHALTVAGLGAAGSCSAARMLTLSVPPLGPGSYTLMLENDLGSSTAPAPIDLAPNPRIVRAPRSVTVDDPCGPGARKVITVTVSGADAVEFSYLGSGQTVTRAGSGGPCDEWQASFSFDFTDKGVITSVPLLGGVRGSAGATDVALTPDVAYAKYRLRGPAFMGATATLTRIERGPGGQPVRSPAGSIGPGEEREFDLTPCVHTTFAYSYTHNGSPVSGEVPEKLGHGAGGVAGPAQL